MRTSPVLSSTIKKLSSHLQIGKGHENGYDDSTRQCENLHEEKLM